MWYHWFIFGVILTEATEFTAHNNMWRLLRLAKQNGDFAFRLYHNIVGSSGCENVLFSPFR